MGSVKIYETSYCDADYYANLLKSSEQTSFPATNTLARIRRSKVWRSNGYFKVISGTNNVLKFREAAFGTVRTATITAGIYTSTTTFMAAVKAAFDDATGSVATYTVTQNSNYKFVITSDLGGGATAFQITFSSGCTAGDLLGFYDDGATDRTGSNAYTADFLRINTEEYITFDLGIPANPTDFALIGRRNEALKISPTATIKIQGSSTDAWTSPEYTETLTYDDEVIITSDSAGLHTEPLRYWRVSLVDQNPNGYLEVGTVFIGETYEPTRGCVVFPFNSSLVDLTKSTRSEGGQSFSDIYEKTQSYNLQWEALTKTELERFLDIFSTFGTGHPFFISFDSGAAFSSSANRMTKYVKFISEPSYSLISPNNFSFSMQLREEL